MADQKAAAPVAYKRGFVMDFLLAGVATSGACIVSNPMEVVKTRMQLQGELAKTAVAGNAVPTVRYRNFAHGFYTICRTEGLVGIQRGLLPGMAYQVRNDEGSDQLATLGLWCIEAFMLMLLLLHIDIPERTAPGAL